jgi:hypothetical protein
MPLDFVQVAFAGHNRAEDLGDVDEAFEGLSKAFALLSEAGMTRARLVTGLAEGADLLAAKAWLGQGLGPVHAVFPHLDDKAELVGDEQVSSTWLDGDSSEAAGRNPHLAQTRWLIGAADLLVVVWTGEQARGAGGTADAVRLALEHLTPVLWIKTPWPGVLHLIRPERLGDDFGFLEFVEELRHEREPLVTEATVESIQEALAHVTPASSDLLHEHAHSQPQSPWLRPLWRTYATFRRTFGGTAPPFEQKSPPPDLETQSGFRRLSQALQLVDERASRLGAEHRSQQIILLGMAILGAIAISISSVWPDLKLECVIVELLFGVGAYLIALASERGRRHELWSSARRLAEDLRLERAAWALGVTTSDRGDFSAGIEARHMRRMAGVPEGRFDRVRVAAWGGWVVDELILGQVAYHRAQKLINGHIAHRVHQLENASFGFLLFMLTGFVVVSAGLMLRSAHPPEWVAGIVMATGSIVPAIGASALALEATLGLAEQGRRSAALASRLHAIAEELGPDPGLDALQGAVKRAIHLARSQEEHWMQSAGRRALVRGG